MFPMELRTPHKRVTIRIRTARCICLCRLPQAAATTKAAPHAMFFFIPVLPYGAKARPCTLALAVNCGAIAELFTVTS